MLRRANETRPQLVCVIADDSASMMGPKASAATQGIREMLLRCQTMGPRGPNRSCFRFALLTFSTHAAVDPGCDAVPVREIDPNQILIEGSGGNTNLAEALELAHVGVSRYIQHMATHPGRDAFPLPVVLVFSDGMNNHGDPLGPAKKIRSLELDGCPVTIAAAGISCEDEDLDERTLRAIASPECYLRVGDLRLLTRFLAEIGSSCAPGSRAIAEQMKRLSLHS